MQSLSQIRALLAERGLRPRRRAGQHFLHDKNQLERLVEAAEIRPRDLVLEVGPGTGTLTEALVERGAEVVACEIDRELAAIIEDRFGSRVRLVCGDCLERSRLLNPEIGEALAGRPFKLVANLPFQVAGTLICAILINHPECPGQFVTIQREVADRLLAEPRTKAYGPLTVIVRSLAEVRQVAVLGPKCFWPVPKVTSAMCAIRPRPDHGIDAPEALARFASSLFSTRRKQLGGIIGPRVAAWPIGVTPDLRPEALSVEQIVALWRGVGEEGTEGPRD
ncbi:MAG: 16S rRNA (adenine(1518)-N(6)/adenine(1519)-N(6))-dimethyltransferase RsmA [Planctomycetota bacterium]|jgi:16S rRNA (adenine1518-N6/adenine1519-N6)-dimethyltransferase